MTVKKISKKNLPDGEVLAWNGTEMIVGFMGKNSKGQIVCETVGASGIIRDVTHYIPKKEIIKLFKSF